MALCHMLPMCAVRVGIWGKEGDTRRKEMSTVESQHVDLKKYSFGAFPFKKESKFILR